jgi:hypothetical protein
MSRLNSYIHTSTSPQPMLPQYGFGKLRRYARYLRANMGQRRQRGKLPVSVKKGTVSIREFTCSTRRRKILEVFDKRGRDVD